LFREKNFSGGRRGTNKRGSEDLALGGDSKEGFIWKGKMGNSLEKRRRGVNRYTFIFQKELGGRITNSGTKVGERTGSSRYRIGGAKE